MCKAQPGSWCSLHLAVPRSSPKASDWVGFDSFYSIVGHPIDTVASLFTDSSPFNTFQRQISEGECKGAVRFPAHGASSFMDH